MKSFILLIGLICAVAHVSDGAKRVVCFHRSVSVLRPGHGRFAVNRIQPALCTHLVYGFAGIAADATVLTLNPSIDFSPINGYLAFTNLVLRNKNLIPMLSIGSSIVHSSRFSHVVSSAANRKIFITSAINLLKKYNFKGLDIYWHTVPRHEKSNFVLLLREIRDAFRKTHYRYQLSVTLRVESHIVTTSYDLPGISRWVDHINLKTFDNVFLPGRAVHHAPQRALERSVALFLSQGAARDLLVIGVAATGRSYTLVDPAINGPDAPVSGPGLPGPFLNEKGVLGYNEICHGNFDIRYSSVWRAPYGVRDNQWVGFDNTNSTTQKCLFARRHRLGGGMLWTIDTDDFTGHSCKRGAYPLLRTIERKC